MMYLWLLAAALKVLHKLMAYEIVTMSSFHAAAMMGHQDILVILLDKVSFFLFILNTYFFIFVFFFFNTDSWLSGAWHFRFSSA